MHLIRSDVNYRAEAVLSSRVKFGLALIAYLWIAGRPKHGRLVW